MHVLIQRALVAGAILIFAVAAHAQDLVNESIPRKWLEEFLPEKLPELKYPAYYNDLDKAKAQAFAGRYKTALLTLRRAPNAGAPEVALVKATALAAIGKRDEAVSILAEKAIADQPRVQVLRARILSEMGRYDDALALLKAHLQKNPDSLAGHYQLGAVSEEVGDLDAARTEYEWIHKTYYDKWQGLGAANFEDAEQVTLMGRAFDRWAVLNSAYANNAPLNNLILRVFVQAYDVIDRNYWPAHVAAAEYFLSHGNSKEAARELSAALAANPSDARCRMLIGLIALEEFNFDVADKQIEAIRSVDPDSPTADILETRALLAQRCAKQAEGPVQRILAKQPKNLEALGLLAACYSLQLKDDKANEVLKQVEKIDPDNATAYVDVADQLAALRQYPRSEKMFEIAIQRAPWMSEARNGLGLLLTQSGDEEKAKIVLDAAYALDPFNYRTTNYLILLDQMAKMDRKESEHFVVIYDKAQDPIIAEYFTDYLESMYKPVCEAFHHQPNVKTYIEVFPTHDSFSARVTGSPWIGTVGASTGRVIALCSPRKGDNTLGAYHWAQVLRHEYTHTVTLSATENRISHWMTEGLAVAQEQAPLRWEWAPMLYNAVKKKELASMDDLTWAFVRPRKPQSRTLGYAQSLWVCQYIEERWGREAILKMMADFAKGRTQDEVFPDVLGIGISQFDKDFFAWAEKQVAGWGYDEATTKKYDALVKQAEELTRGREYAKAIDVWQEAMKLRPMDALPHQRLAGLYLARDTYEPQKALEQLVRLHEATVKDNRFAKRIARLYLELNEPAKAEQFAMESVYIDPYDPNAHQVLLAACEKSGNAQGVEREKRVIPQVEAWLKEYRKSTLLEGAPEQ